MKRIESIVSGVSEKVRAAFKTRRIEKALDMAKLNAQEDLSVAKADLEELALHCSEDMDAATIINAISEKMDAIELAEATLARLKKVEDFLNSEEE